MQRTSSDCTSLAAGTADMAGTVGTVGTVGSDSHQSSCWCPGVLAAPIFCDDLTTTHNTPSSQTEEAVVHANAIACTNSLSTLAHLKASGGEHLHRKKLALGSPACPILYDIIWSTVKQIALEMA